MACAGSNRKEQSSSMVRMWEGADELTVVALFENSLQPGIDERWMFVEVSKCLQQHGRFRLAVFVAAVLRKSLERQRGE